MVIIVFCALLLLSARVTSIYKKNICDVMTMSFAGCLMVMYVFAFFRLLPGIYLVGAAVIIYCLIRGGVKTLKVLADPNVIFLIISLALVGICTSDLVFTWWDDINFWSSDAKAMYFLGGFPGKYGNVSPEFGDYPPLTSLTKWLFLQLSPGQYKENLQFLGYFALNAIFLLPLPGKIKNYIDSRDYGVYVKTVLSAVSFLAVMLLPGVFNGIIYFGTPADISMAIIYGALLLAIMDDAGHGKLFYYGRIALYVSVLLLSKSVGFEWALFALIFYFIMANRDKWILLPIACGGASLGSWLLFCLVNRRVAKLTGAGIRMATSGTYRPPENTGDKMKFFFEGFALQPMHADKNLTFDLSMGAVVVIIFAFIALLYYGNILGKRETKKIFLFTLLTGALSFGIVFLAHISIFQTEEQYLDAYAMAVSIARYCAPFALGTTILLSGVLFMRLTGRREKKYRYVFALFLAAIFLTADYSGVYRHLVGHGATAAEDMAYVEDMVGPDGRQLADTVTAGKDLWGKRVVVMRDGHQYYWVHNAYISKAASPVALVYDTFLAEADNPASVTGKILDSHASYIYIEDDGMLSKDLFEPLMADGAQLKSRKVYRVLLEDGGVRLLDR